MDPGHVITARGIVISMDELRMKARRPLVDKVDHKDKVQPPKRPARQLNVRGFMPSMSGVANPNTEEEEPMEEAVVEPTGPSLADLTGITVDNPRFIKERPANPVKVADATLREIMGDLDQFKSRDPAKTQDDNRRARKA